MASGGMDAPASLEKGGGRR